MQNIPEKIVPIDTKFVKETMSEEIKQSRSLKLFENAIRSEYTRKNYSCTLKKFMEFVDMEDYDRLVSLPEKEIQAMLEDYVMHLKTCNLNPNSLPIIRAIVLLRARRLLPHPPPQP